MTTKDQMSPLHDQEENLAWSRKGSAEIQTWGLGQSHPLWAPAL